MNILITGASGFIGSHLTAGLSKKYTLLTPNHSQLDLLDGKKVETYFSAYKVDCVIHCAVIGGNGPQMHIQGMFYDNVRIFFNLVRCRKYYKRLINIGSGAVYDKRFPITSVPECDFGKHIPNDEYGLYKYICSQYISTTDSMVDLRVFGIFGAGEDYRYRFVSNALCRYLYGLPITINKNVFFDYLDVRDFVRIVGYFITHTPKYPEYNVGRGERISLLEIARMIAKLGKEMSAIKVKQTGLGNEYTGDISRLHKEIPSFRYTSFKKSVTDLYAWYLTQKKHIDPKSL